MMRFLVIYRSNPTMAAEVPLPARWEMVEATSHYLEELQKAGKVLDGGFIAGSYGGLAIYEVDSLSELDELSDRLPARAMCDTEVIPFRTTEEFNSTWPKQKEYMRQMLEKMTQGS